MGPEQVLRNAAALVCAFAGVASAIPKGAPIVKDRVAVIDLGPDAGSDATARTQLAADLRANDALAPIDDPQLADAYAGIPHDTDEAPLADALARAQKAFGALDCTAATAAAADAIGIGAARQAAGYPVPELARAWTYTLLCADRGGDTAAAATAADRLRAVGGGSDAPAAVLAKYATPPAPGETFPVEIRADVDGAEIWIDHAHAGTSPLATTLAAGPHVIAAATADGRRGWAAGTAVKTQPTIPVVTADRNGPYAALARRIAGWHGERPSPDELAAALEAGKVQYAIVRHGDALEAWQHFVASEAPQVVGGERALRHLKDAPRLVLLLAARARAFGDHAPDPNQPLLVETAAERAEHNSHEPFDPPTKWYVYATIAAVIGTGVALVVWHANDNSVQNVELHYP